MDIMKLVQSLRTEPWALMPEHFTTLLHNAIRVMTGKMTKDDSMAAFGGTENQDAGDVTERPSIAVIPIRGLMLPRPNWYSACGSIGLIEAVQAAAADNNIKGIILDIDSPGGSVYQIPELADAVYVSRGAKPIWAISNTLAASAAYWVGSQAGKFFASPSADVGSIGIWMSHEDWSKFYQDFGVDVTLISAGKFKVEGHPFGPLDEEALTALQGSVDETYADFLKAVARGRGVSIDVARDGMGEGRVVSAVRAKEMNMIDEIATFAQVVEMMLNEIGTVAAGRGRAIGAVGVHQSAEAGVSVERDADDSSDDVDVPTVGGATSETTTENPYRGSSEWRKRKLRVLTS